MAGLTGVLGGTFDPPHLGHRILADEARFQLDLDRVLWVVTAQPPHKPDVRLSPADVRAEMVVAAVGGDPHFEVSRADLDRPGPHFSVDTLAWLSSRYPGSRWAFLMGADSLRDLPGWHHPEELLRACEVLGVMSRPDIDVHLEDLEARLPGLQAKLRWISAPLVDLASQEIRRRAQEGRPYRYWVPEAVADIIDRHRLYRE
ncbi:MAG: nicotinate (nicotinamide) nucleotide adenylyltransferase [Gammaproteobacteria bacterium RBG_16_66_13]|nr:MAG: nicotinate (nicotinamide) nucleotide adenylyltransferase [Gammaproteobacteria bacterium RBG_16_66_13]